MKLGTTVTLSESSNSIPHETARENFSFCVLLPVTLFSKNIQSNFTLILTLKKIERTTAGANYIRQYLLNFS